MSVVARRSLAAIGAALAALYCWFGIAMNAALSVAAETERQEMNHRRAVGFFTLGFAASLLALVTLLVSLWRHRRPSRPAA